MFIAAPVVPFTLPVFNIAAPVPGRPVVPLLETAFLSALSLGVFTA